MKIAVLGAGNMGRAIIHGLIASDKSVAIDVWDVSPEACRDLPPQVCVVEPQQWFSKEMSPDAVILAVKPTDIKSTASLISSLMQANGKCSLLVSIAAGISVAILQSVTEGDVRICRVMPNTPARVGFGMSAFACSENCTEEDKNIVSKVFTSCGRVMEVPEKLLHAVTGLSGSGPAYTFLFIEALIEGGISVGLPYNVARECAVQTVLGAAAMVQQSTDHTASLKAAVMSPGGTTVTGLNELEKAAFKHSVISAVSAATRRSAELGT